MSTAFLQCPTCHECWEEGEPATCKCGCTSDPAIRHERSGDTSPVDSLYARAMAANADRAELMRLCLNVADELREIVRVMPAKHPQWKAIMRQKYALTEGVREIAERLDRSA